MIEKPNLPDEQIIACLRDDYGLPGAEVAFLPIGNDSSAWACTGPTMPEAQTGCCCSAAPSGPL